MLNLASVQTSQADRVDTLKKEIEKAKALLASSVLNQGKKDYPKIQVHSSCVIADANGGYSNTGTSSSTSTSNFMDTKMTMNSPSPATGNNAILAKAISGLLSGGVNINLSS